MRRFGAPAAATVGYEIPLKVVCRLADPDGVAPVLVELETGVGTVAVSYPRRGRAEAGSRFSRLTSFDPALSRSRPLRAAPSRQAAKDSPVSLI